MKNTKKAQITVFMILGIVLLMGGVLLFYTSSKNKIKSRDTNLNTNEIESYVQSCLTKSLKNKLILIGEQGGMLYKKDQNGLFDSFSSRQKGFSFLTYNNRDTLFLLKPPSLPTANFNVTPPEYPWPGFPNRGGHDDFTGYFGVNMMLPLAKINPISHRQVNYSIQEELESSILGDMDLCDFGSFGNKSGIKISQPNLEVKIGDIVSATLNYQIKISDVKTGAKTQYANFSEMIPLNFAGMYRFISTMIQKDSENITYDIRTASNDDFSVYVVNDVYGFDDLVVVESKKAKIDGKPYVFKFARANRIPAMNYMVISSHTLTEGSPIDKAWFSLRTFDPDEDNVTVTFLINNQRPIFVSGNTDTITHNDLCSGNIFINVSVTDGQYTDYQMLSNSKGTMHAIIPAIC